MERLTYTSPLGNRVSKGACKSVQCKTDCNDCEIDKIISKLWEYEEIGLTPEEVESLDKADKEGRVLDYMPGDTVYDRFGMAWTVTSSEIHKFGDGPFRYLYRCGHPGTDDYCALYSEEIQPPPEAGL